MANVNLPVPVLLAGGALCLLGGYLVGVVAGPDAPDSSTATVESYDQDTRRLCLSGDTVAEEEDVDDEGMLCGTWQRSSGAESPHVGDSFRFVTVRTAEAPAGSDSDVDRQVLIYGYVVD